MLYLWRVVVFLMVAGVLSLNIEARGAQYESFTAVGKGRIETCEKAQGLANAAIEANGGVKEALTGSCDCTQISGPDYTQCIFKYESSNSGS
jgi:hypothetical protein